MWNTQHSEAPHFSLRKIHKYKLCKHHKCKNPIYGKPQEQIASAANKKAQYFDPFTPMSDQDRISPHNINTISTR